MIVKFFRKGRRTVHYHARKLPEQYGGLWMTDERLASLVEAELPSYAKVGDRAVLYTDDCYPLIQFRVAPGCLELIKER